jgi:fumarate reductase flavoprotein subunit
LELLPEKHTAVEQEGITVCLTCHSRDDAKQTFDWVIHFDHYAGSSFDGDCWSCHLIDKAGNLRLIGRDGIQMTVKAPKETMDKMGFYYRSWASSTHLDHKHAQKQITCILCHKAYFPEKRISMEQCLNCHESYDRVAELTEDLEPNPHFSHFVDLRCTLCHKGHEPSVLYCNKCHEYDLKVP